MYWIIYSLSHCAVPNVHYTETFAITVLDHLCGGCLPFHQEGFFSRTTLAYLLEIVCLGSEVEWGWGWHSGGSVVGSVREIQARLTKCTERCWEENRIKWNWIYHYYVIIRKLHFFLFWLKLCANEWGYFYWIRFKLSSLLYWRMLTAKP